MEKVVKELIIARKYALLPDPQNNIEVTSKNKEKDKFRLIAHGKKKKLPITSLFFRFKRENRRPRNQISYRKFKTTKFKSFAVNYY